MPPSKPTSEPGVFVVVKLSITPSPLLLPAVIVQSDVEYGPEPNSLLKAERPGKVISTLLLTTVPVVTSTRNVPENAQVVSDAQEFKLSPETFIALPDMSNEVIVSAAAKAGAKSNIATVVLGSTKRLKYEQENLFILFFLGRDVYRVTDEGFDFLQARYHY